MSDYSSTFLTGNKAAIRVFLVSEISFFVFLMLFYPPNRLATVEAKSVLNSTLLPSTESPDPFFNQTKDETRRWFPIDLMENIQQEGNGDKSCASPPNISDITFIDGQWQEFVDSNGTVSLLLAAYLDDRATQLIRIIGLIDSSSRSFDSRDLSWRCKLWFSNSTKPVMSNVVEVIPIWSDDGDVHDYDSDIFLPYIFTCSIPEGITATPDGVSVVNGVCDRVTNLLKVFKETPASEGRKEVAVCINDPLSLIDDQSMEIIQFVEASRYFGADKIFLNHFGVKFGIHPNVQQVLDYYETHKIVQVAHIRPTNGLPTDAYLTQKIIESNHGKTKQAIANLVFLHHCLYKNLNNFNYILIAGTNELFVPKMGTSYSDVLKLTKKLSDRQPVAAYHSHLKTFIGGKGVFPGIPAELKFLQTINVQLNHSSLVKESTVTFLDTRKVVAFDETQPLVCLDLCKETTIPSFVGQTNSYQRVTQGVTNDLSDIANTTIDTTLWKFKDDLIGRMVKVLHGLKQ